MSLTASGMYNLAYVSSILLEPPLHLFARILKDKMKARYC